MYELFEAIAAWVREKGIRRALAVLVFVVLPVVAAVVIAVGHMSVIP